MAPVLIPCAEVTTSLELIPAPHPPPPHGGGGMIGGGLKLYTKATSSIKTEDKGSNTVIPFYDHHKSRLVETMTFWAECHGGF